MTTKQPAEWKKNVINIGLLKFLKKNKRKYYEEKGNNKHYILYFIFFCEHNITCLSSSTTYENWLFIRLGNYG